MANAICTSCSGKHQNPNEEVKHTFRNGEYRPLCLACWRAALQVQELTKVGNRAEEAMRRHQIDRLLGDR